MKRRRTHIHKQHSRIFYSFWCGYKASFKPIARLLTQKLNAVAAPKGIKNGDDAVNMGSHYLVYSMAFLWLWSGIQPALFALPQSLDLLARVGFQAAYCLPMFALSCALDVFFGLGCCTRLRDCAWFWAAQAAVVLGYSVIIAFRLPEMWAHPFAPLVKNVPILAVLIYLCDANRRAQP